MHIALLGTTTWLPTLLAQLITSSRIRVTLLDADTQSLEQTYTHVLDAIQSILLDGSAENYIVHLEDAVSRLAMVSAANAESVQADLLIDILVSAHMPTWTPDSSLAYLRYFPA